MNKCQQRDHQELYQRLVETTGTGYVVLDTSSRILDANKEYVLLAGHRRLEEIRGRSVLEWTAAYDKKKNSEAIKECFKKGKIRGLEIDYVDTKGKISTLEINATVVEDKGKRIILTLCRDVSERKKMQEELRQREALLKAQLENSPDAIMVLGRDYRYISINHNVFTKFNLKELIGKYSLQFLPADARALVKSKIDRCFATGELQEFEHPMGNGLWALARIVALRSSETIDRVMVISTNITERKHAEEALTQKNIALGEMIKQIDYEKEKTKKEIAVNVEELLLPTLEKLHLKGHSSKYIQVLERNLKELTTSFGLKITDKKNRLTSKEIELCNMIKSGLSSKDISGLLNISSLTVSKHRRNIRKKLSICNKDVNLVSFLRSL
jgi:PAS domain S-box-containing protein